MSMVSKGSHLTNSCLVLLLAATHCDGKEWNQIKQSRYNGKKILGGLYSPSWEV